MPIRLRQRGRTGPKLQNGRLPSKAADETQVSMLAAVGSASRLSQPQVSQRGYEGLVGKDEASPYVEGRTLSWLKVKVPNYREGERGWEPKG